MAIPSASTHTSAPTLKGTVLDETPPISLSQNSNPSHRSLSHFLPESSTLFRIQLQNGEVSGTSLCVQLLRFAVPFLLAARRPPAFHSALLSTTAKMLHFLPFVAALGAVYSVFGQDSAATTAAVPAITLFYSINIDASASHTTSQHRKTR